MLITDPYWFNTGADYGSSDCIRHSPRAFLPSPFVQTTATNPGHGTKIIVRYFTLFPLCYSRCSYSYILLSLLIESPRATQATRGVSGKRSLMHPARSLLVSGGRPYLYFSLCCVYYQPLHRRQGCLIGRWVSVDFPPPPLVLRRLA